MSTTGENHYYMMDDEPFVYLNLGTNATPVWTAILNAEEISADLSKGQVEFKPRGSKFTLKRGGKKEAPISFKYNRPRVADAIYDALWDSYVNDTPIQLAIVDLAITDAAATGFSAYCEVFGMPLVAGSGENGVVYDIQAEPTDYVESGALVLPELIEDTSS